MAALVLESLTAPVDDQDPCGPDLDAEDDDAFASFVATSEMVLPDRFFVEDHEGNRRPFYTDDRFKDVDLGASIATGTKLLARTHDLRVLGLVAKLYIFDRKLTEFQICVAAMASLLETFWDEVHPAPGSDLRADVLERLNEQYTVVTALAHAPLLRSRRYGSVSWHSYLAAVREASGNREDASTLAIDRVLAEEAKADLAPVEAAQASFKTLAQALARINAVCAEKLPSGPPNLGRLSETVRSIRTMLDRVNPPSVVDEADADEPGGAASEGGALTAAGDAGFASTAAAGRALAEATSFLAKSEPSSPAILLLRQAHALVGKSFLEALESLLPDQMGRAILNVGALPAFDQPLLQIAQKGETPSSFDGGADSEADAEDGADPPAAVIASRQDALATLDRVVAHYRAVEPSSPIPLIIERAKGLVGKDFMSLIRTMLPDSVLRGE